MQPFTRSFDVGALATWDHEHPGNAVRHLFDRWALPGERGSPERPLRVGIRAGYLNLYMKGQSVAKLSSGRAGPTIEVHEAYVTGRTPQGSPGAGPRYVLFDADRLASAEMTALINGWITIAERFAGAEKRFVDDLIGDNPGVIDVEMGLPAGDKPGDRVAPWMDLVVAQLDGETASIAFWEAKCANNSELRRRGDAPPKVLDQLDKYRRWMTPDRIGEVSQAYRETAGILRGLQILFRADARSECLAIWRALKADTPAVIVQPGIVIGNYWSEGSKEASAGQIMTHIADSFASNGHYGKIARAGVTVHEVGPDHNGPALPRLPHVAAAA